MRYKSKLILIFFITVSFSYAQSNTSSPYSRFGIGELDNSFSAYFQSMGDASIALLNNKYINPNNPASYSLISSKKFIFHTSLKNNTTLIKSNTDNEFYNNTLLSSLIIGFPLNQKTSFSSGFIPFSHSGYDLYERDSIFQSDKFYKGSGGLSKLYFGSSYKISNKLSLGVNVSYLFGSINRNKRIIFDDESIFHSRSTERISINGFDYDFGLLYKHKLNDNDFSFAIVLNNENKISSKRYLLNESFEFSGFNELAKDTFLNNTERGDLILPEFLDFGFSYNLNSLTIIAEYSVQDWINYSFFGEKSELINSNKFKLGFEYFKNGNNSSKFSSNLKYRFGFYNHNTPIEINNNTINEKGVSLGISMPNIKSRTIYDLSLLFGNRGTTNDNLINEKFFEIALSINFDAIWFIIRKYD